MSAESSPPAAPASTDDSAGPADPTSLDVLRVYRELATLPELTSAWIVPAANTSASDNDSQQWPGVIVGTSVRDIEQDLKRDYHTHYTASTATGHYSPFPYTTPVDIIGYFPSPSNDKLLIVKKLHTKTPATPNTSPQFVFDVYDRGGRLLSSTPTTGHHGKILTGGLFGSLSWHPSEQYVVYTAEPEKPVLGGYYDAVKGNPNSDMAEKPKDSRGQQFDWREDYGEQMSGITHPRPFVISLNHSQTSFTPPVIRSINEIPEHLTLGSAVFVPTPDTDSDTDSDSDRDSASVLALVCVGWDHSNRRMGMAFYNTRPSTIYHLKLSLKTERHSAYVNKSRPGKDNDKYSIVSLVPLTSDDHSAIGPRFSLDGRSLVYTTTDRLWHHWSTSKLKCIDWAGGNKQSHTVIDIVREPKTIDDFPGFYPLAGLLPVNTWLSDNTHIVTSTYWRCRERVVLINTKTGRFYELPLPLSLDSELVNGSMSVMTMKNDCVIVSASTLVQPAAAFLAKITVTGDTEPTIEWRRLTSPPSLLHSQAHERLTSLRFEIVQIQPNDSDVSYRSYSALPFDALLIYPTYPSDKLPSLHVCPHGGPHSVFTTSHSFALSFLGVTGHAVLLVNYRGSTGYGQASLESLPGHCGDQDVRDCMTSLDYAKQRYHQRVNINEIGVFGGSHGGFLTCHLIGQFPDAFYCASTRNPVTNCAAMIALTDIVDWCYFECGLDYDPARGPTPEDLALLLAASPIHYIERVKTPLLVLLGASDRRVPPQQGIDYFRILRSRGVDCRLLVYPDAQHGLNDSVSQEADVWLNTVQWMMRRRPGSRHFHC